MTRTYPPSTGKQKLGRSCKLGRERVQLPVAIITAVNANRETVFFKGTYHAVLSILCHLGNNCCSFSPGTAVSAYNIRSNEHLPDQGTHMVESGHWDVMFEQEVSTWTLHSDDVRVIVLLSEKLPQLQLLLLALEVARKLFRCNVGSNVGHFFLRNAYVAARMQSAWFS